MIECLPFTLVLAGGGARGFAHAGVLQALDQRGLRPSALVGVSMGGLVAATYVAREDWYNALSAIDTSGFPHPAHDHEEGREPLLRRAVTYVHAAWNMVSGWGAPPSAVEAGREVMQRLFGSTRFEDARIPVAICATDLISGKRVTMQEGDLADAVYASAALAGVLPPLSRNEHLLADGTYADIAPVDVARQFGFPAVMVVDPRQLSGPPRIRNGLQSVMRAMEICHQRHAELRMREADLVVRPEFDRAIDVLDFDARDECVEAGMRAVERQWPDIRSILRVREPAG